jgi:rhodanese-related sulfurtransferase
MKLLEFLKGSSISNNTTQAVRWIENGALLLDVRTRDEYEAGHLPSAKNIPVQELSKSLDAVGTKDTPIVVYCRSGMRSATAASLLRDAGYTVCDLGAMHNWPN